MQDDELRPFYEALGKRRNIPPRAAAMSDYLKRPSLEGLDISGYAGQPGDQIYFLAADNVGVLGAVVTIGDGNGTVFESGSAVEVETDSGYWMYDAKNAIPAGTTVAINVKVSDRPGTTVEVTQQKAL
jgi:hypothetical protein